MRLITSPVFILGLVSLLFVGYLYADFITGDTFYIYIQAGYGGDDYRVYLPVILFFHDWLQDPSIYSLQIGAGESIFAWANILFDPFDWPLIAADKSAYPTLVLYIQLLKHIAVFGAGYAWLREMRFGAFPGLVGAVCLGSVVSLLSAHYQFVSYYLLTLVYLWGIERWPDLARRLAEEMAVSTRPRLRPIPLVERILPGVGTTPGHFSADPADIGAAHYSDRGTGPRHSAFRRKLLPAGQPPPVVLLPRPDHEPVRDGSRRAACGARGTACTPSRQGGVLRFFPATSGLTP